LGIDIFRAQNQWWIKGDGQKPSPQLEGAHIKSENLLFIWRNA